MNHLNSSTSSAGEASTIEGVLLMVQHYKEAALAADEEELLMPEWGFTVASAALLLIGLFGFFFNLTVIVLMCKDVQLWTPINIILLNLVCSDFSVSIFGNPFTLTAAIYRRWIFGPDWCVFYGFFMSLLGITSITTLTVLAYERYCLVCRPLATHQVDTRHSYWSIIFIWSYSFLVTAPPLLGLLLPGYSWGRYVLEPPNISCSVNWNSHSHNARSYILYLFAFGLIVPLAVILFSYANILRTMKQNTVRTGQVNKAEAKVTVMVGLMICLFMVAWTPYSIFALLEQFGPGVSPALAVLPALLAKSSIIYNPIIYVGMNSQYRAAWVRFWSGGSEDSAGGLRSTIDSTVHMLSSRFSLELEVLKKKQTKQPRCHASTTIVEEFSVMENNSLSNSLGNHNNRDLCIKDVLVVQQQQSGGVVLNKCTAVTRGGTANHLQQQDLGDTADGNESIKSRV